MRPRRLLFGLALALGLWLVPVGFARAQYGIGLSIGPPGYSYTAGFGLGVPYGISTGYGFGYAAPYGPYFPGPGHAPAPVVGTGYYSSAYSVYAAPGATFVSGRVVPYVSAVGVPAYGLGYRPVVGSYGFVGAAPRVGVPYPVTGYRRW